MSSSSLSLRGVLGASEVRRPDITWFVGKWTHHHHIIACLGANKVTHGLLSVVPVLSPKQLALTRLFFSIFFIKENSNLLEAFRD